MPSGAEGPQSNQLNVDSSDIPIWFDPLLPESIVDDILQIQQFTQVGEVSESELQVIPWSWREIGNNGHIVWWLHFPP